MDSIHVASIADPINPRLRQEIYINPNGLKVIVDIINECLGTKALNAIIAQQQARIAELEAKNNEKLPDHMAHMMDHP